MEDKTYFIINSTVQNSDQVELNSDNTALTFNDLRNKEKITVPSNVFVTNENDEEYIKITIENLLHNNITTSLLYSGINKTNFNFMNNILICVIEYFFKKFQLCDYKEKYSNTLKSIKDLHLQNTYSMCCTVTGVYNNQYYNLMNPDQSCLETLLFDDMIAAEVKSVSDFMLFLIAKIKETLLNNSSLVDCSLIIYSLFYKARDNETLSHCFTAIDIGELNKFAKDINKNNSELLDQKQILANAKQVLRKHVKKIITNEENKFFGTIIKLSNIDSVQQGQHLFKFLSEISTKYSNFITEFEKQYSEANGQEELKLKIKYEKKISQMKKAHASEIQNVDRHVRKEVVDTLSASYNNVIESQRQSFNDLLEETRKLHESKMQALEKNYEEKLTILKKQNLDNKSEIEENQINKTQIKEMMQTIIELQDSNRNLQNQKSKLQEELTVCQKRLDDIQNVLLGKKTSHLKVKSSTDYPSSNEDISNSLIANAKPKPDLESVDVNQEHICDSKNLLIEKQRLLDEAKDQINNMKIKIESLELLKQQFHKQILLNEYTIAQNKKESSEIINDLTEQNQKLSHDIETMKARHNDQFQKYEKIIKKDKDEIERQKREVYLIRQHYTNSPFLQKTPENTIKSTLSLQSINMATLKSEQSTPKTVEESSMHKSRKLRSGKKLLH